MRAAVRDERQALEAAKPKVRRTRAQKLSAADSFQNFGLNLGMGTQNALSGSTYGFNPITRVKILVEWIYRGTWIGGAAVNHRAEDMTRAGVQVNTTMPPDDVEKLTTSYSRKGMWRGMKLTKQWASLYGGAIGVLLVDGQRLDEPLRVETIGKGQFKGMAVLDRWMVDPSITAGGLVDEMGPHLGQPKYYAVRSDSSMMPGGRIHYSRCLRLLGDEMPYWQSVMENLWGTSVYERIYDRLVAFDSATQGVAQTCYKSYVRTYKIEKLRDLVTAGGPAYQGLLRYVQMMRTFQGIEGVTLIDGKDDFVAHTPNATPGMSEALVQFGQQLCGALRQPAVRLFGMSPAGLNSTGESDWRNYYDGVNVDQEAELREFVDLTLRVNAMSEGLKLPDGFGFNFTPLWQMTSKEKAEVAAQKTTTVLETQASGLYGRATALKELRQQSHETGVHTNITDEDIEAAVKEDEMNPPGAESVEQGGGAEEGEDPNGQSDPEVKNLESLHKIGRAVGAGSADRLGGGTPAAARARAPGPHPPSSPPRGVAFDERTFRDWVRARDYDALPMFDVGGMPVLLEVRKGEERWPGKVWPADYGYIRRTVSNEGPDEAVDCFVGPQRDAQTAWVINHFKDDGDFEEHKIMFGYPTAHAAIDDYAAAYPRQGRQAAFNFTLPKLKDWLETGDMTRPVMRSVAA